MKWAWAELDVQWRVTGQPFALLATAFTSHHSNCVGGSEVMTVNGV